MKKLFTYVIMLYASLSVSVAQQIQYPEPVLNPESCTSIMVGKKASADGSVMTSHTCDSNYRTWMDIVPSASYDHDTTTTVAPRVGAWIETFVKRKLFHKRYTYVMKYIFYGT